MDAFNVAFRIPNLARDLFAEGAMSAAFVPTFTRHLTLEGREEAWRLGSNVLCAIVLVTGFLVVAGIAVAHPLVGAFAGSYAQVPGKLELTVRLTRLMLPYLTCVAIAAAMMGMLNSLHYYFLPALSPAMFNVATIACALALVPIMPALGLPRIMAIAIATVLGGVGQIALQWPLLWREGFRPHLRLDWTDPGLRQILILMGPGTVGLAAVQINVFVNTFLATGQGTGAVSWLNYAFRLMYLPIGLFGVSIATAVLPAVSRHAAIDDLEGVRSTIARGMAMMLMLNVPATLGLLTLATPIVQVLFEHGRFGPADTRSTAAALRLYALGLVGYSTVRIASPVFYALRRSRVPVLVSALAVFINVVLSFGLVGVMGFRGLALGTSVAATANAAILMIMLRRRLAGLDGRRLAGVLTRVMVAALVMAAAAGLAERLMLALLPGGRFSLQVIRLAAAIGSGLVALALVSRALGLREFDEAAGLVARRLVGHRVSTTPADR